MSTSDRTDKAKYKYHRKDKSSNTVDVNLRGFLCSCNNREKDCVRECYNILNTYADELYGSVSSTNESHAEPEDISVDLTKELEFLRQRKSRFRSLNSGAKNLIFISTTLENPVGLAQKIVTDIHEKKRQQTRYLIRLVPIDITCRAHMKNIEKAFEPLADKYFKSESKNFSVVYNHRMNNSLSRDEVIKMIADKVMATRDDHKVNLKEADICIVIEIIKSMALIGVVPNYLQFKKYNLLALSDDTSTKSDGESQGNNLPISNERSPDGQSGNDEVANKQ